MALRTSRLSGTIGPGRRATVHIVVADGYHPDHIAVAEGVPLRLVFHRDENHPCSDKVVFSAPRLERRLAPRATTVVDLPPLWGTDIRFTCGMGRYRGRIELVPAADSSTSRAHRSLTRAAGAALLAGFASMALLAGRNPEIGTVVGAAAAIVAAILVVALDRRLAAPTRAGFDDASTPRDASARGPGRPATDRVGTDLGPTVIAGVSLAASPATATSTQPTSRERNP